MLPVLPAWRASRRRRPHREDGRDGSSGLRGGRFKCLRCFGGSVTRPDNGVPTFDAKVERNDDAIALLLTGEFDLAAKDDF